MARAPYNPLDKRSIGQNIVRELMAAPCVSLPSPKSLGKESKPDPSPFEGAGIYAIYYFGDFAAYNRVKNTSEKGCQSPIYIGKADPKGGRKGSLELDSSGGFVLFNRLREHAASIEQASNLELIDFRCRHLPVDDVWIGLGERLAIQIYLPIWNTLVDGFGNHDPGNRRSAQYKSDWDVLHPGRRWAEKLGQSPRTAEQIVAAIFNPPSREELVQQAFTELAEEN